MRQSESTNLTTFKKVNSVSSFLHLNMSYFYGYLLNRFCNVYANRLYIVRYLWSTYRVDEYYKKYWHTWECSMSTVLKKTVFSITLLPDSEYHILVNITRSYPFKVLRVINKLKKISVCWNCFHRVLLMITNIDPEN